MSENPAIADFVGSSTIARKYVNLSTFDRDSFSWIALLKESQNSVHSWIFPVNFLTSSFGNLTRAGWVRFDAGADSFFWPWEWCGFSCVLTILRSLRYHHRFRLSPRTTPQFLVQYPLFFSKPSRICSSSRPIVSIFSNDVSFNWAKAIVTSGERFSVSSFTFVSFFVFSLFRTCSSFFTFLLESQTRLEGACINNYTTYLRLQFMLVPARWFKTPTRDCLLSNDMRLLRSIIIYYSSPLLSLCFQTNVFYSSKHDNFTGSKLLKPYRSHF